MPRTKVIHNSKYGKLSLVELKKLIEERKIDHKSRITKKEHLMRLLEQYDETPEDNQAMMNLIDQLTEIKKVEQQNKKSKSEKKKQKQKELEDSDDENNEKELVKEKKKQKKTEQQNNKIDDDNNNSSESFFYSDDSQQSMPLEEPEIISIPKRKPQTEDDILEFYKATLETLVKMKKIAEISSTNNHLQRVWSKELDLINNKLDQFLNTYES
jgi:hypothetical protein